MKFKTVRMAVRNPFSFLTTKKAGHPKAFRQTNAENVIKQLQILLCYVIQQMLMTMFCFHYYFS